MAILARHFISAIRAELTRTGRSIDPDHYGATLPVRAGEASGVLARAREYLAAGATKLVLIPLARGTRDFDALAERLVAEVIPTLEES